MAHSKWLKYRTVKKAVKTIQHGPSVGTVQYLGRQVVKKNYANPVVRRHK